MERRVKCRFLNRGLTARGSGALFLVIIIYEARGFHGGLFPYILKQPLYIFLSMILSITLFTPGNQYPKDIKWYLVFSLSQSYNVLPEKNHRIDAGEVKGSKEVKGNRAAGRENR